jgi:hypothetical protein
VSSSSFPSGFDRLRKIGRSALARAGEDWLVHGVFAFRCRGEQKSWQKVKPFLEADNVAGGFLLENNRRERKDSLIFSVSAFSAVTSPGFWPRMNTKLMAPARAFTPTGCAVFPQSGGSL